MHSDKYLRGDSHPPAPSNAAGRLFGENPKDDGVSACEQSLPTELFDLRVNCGCCVVLDCCMASGDDRAEHFCRQHAYITAHSSGRVSSEYRWFGFVFLPVNNSKINAAVERVNGGTERKYVRQCRCPCIAPF